MKKLLATTSVMALAASPAYAQLLANFGTAAGTEIDAEVTLAEEVDLSAGADGVIELEIVTQGTIPSANNVIAVINITGATFDGALTGGEVVQGAATGATNASVVTGGADGGTTVEYNITPEAGDQLPNGGAPEGADHISILLPVTFTACSTDMGLTVSTFETELGTPIEGGSATFENSADENIIVTCDNGFSAALVDDGTDPSGADSVLDFSAVPALSLFVTPNGATAGVYNADTTTVADIGVWSLEVEAGVDKDLIGTAIAETDVTGCDIDVAFEDDDGIASLATDDAAANDSLFEDTSITIAANAANIDCSQGTSTDSPATLGVTITPADIEPQDLTCTGVIEFGAGFVSTEPLEACTLDNLDPESFAIGPFDWIGDAGALTRNVLRITQFGSSIPTITATLENSSVGNNGDCGELTPLGDVNELRVNGSVLEDACGDFGRADVTLNFFVEDAAGMGIDVDRLMASGDDNVISAFGNDTDDIIPHGDD